MSDLFKFVADEIDRWNEFENDNKIPDDFFFKYRDIDLQVQPVDQLLADSPDDFELLKIQADGKKFAFYAPADFFVSIDYLKSWNEFEENASWRDFTESLMQGAALKRHQHNWDYPEDTQPNKVRPNLRICASCGDTEKMSATATLCLDCADVKMFVDSRNDAIDKARYWLSTDFVIIDTETTDLNGFVVEIAIIDSLGNPLLNTLVRPPEPVSIEAKSIHGISNKSLENAPVWSDIHLNFISAIKNKVVLIYNKKFDHSIICRSSWMSVEDQEEFAKSQDCVMLEYAKYFGQYSNYHKSFTWQKLSNAAEEFDALDANAHRALEDCKMTLAVIHGMAITEKSG
ncbi:MAG: DNA polymerase-3 subunit epsilon [Oceanicoccus sp.]|jgi:DNA polymerase-3 subunit epsilon